MFAALHIKDVNKGGNDDTVFTRQYWGTADRKDYYVNLYKLAFT